MERSRISYTRNLKHSFCRFPLLNCERRREKNRTRYFTEVYQRGPQDFGVEILLVGNRLEMIADALNPDLHQRIWRCPCALSQFIRGF